MKKSVGAALAAAVVTIGLTGSARAAETSILVFNPLEPLAILSQATVSTSTDTPTAAVAPAPTPPVVVPPVQDPQDKDKPKRSKDKPPKDNDQD
jgi:hypothetical protein